MSQDWLEASLSVLGTVLTVALFVAPWKTVQQMHKMRMTFSPVPYLSIALNCLLWLTYGLVSGNNLLLLVNSVGLCLSCYYNWICYQVAEHKDPVLLRFSATLVIFIFALGWVLYVPLPDNMAQHLGLIAGAASVSMFGSPLINMATVIRTRNAESIPGLIALANASCALTWTLYGWVIQDSYVIWPNFIGAVLGFVQLGLKLLYKNPGKSSSGVFSLLPTTK